jgi:hypothetical protein
MSAPQTEYPFTLPVGLVDADGAHHREGSMRLATARDEIEPLRDARVRENGAYLSVLKLARVLTNVGSIQPVTPAHVEQLYAADFAHLESLYAQVNSASAGDSAPTSASASADASPLAPDSQGSTQIARAPVAATTPSPVSASRPPAFAPPRPPALAGVSAAALDWMLDGGPRLARDADAVQNWDLPERSASGDASIAAANELDAHAALPIGLVQDRERTIAREALARSGTPPRRGRIHEGLAPHADVLHEREAPSEQLMRLSSQPPATPTPLDSAGLTASNDTAEGDLSGRGGAMDMEDVYEEMIVRLRRELLVERERMGAPLGG